MYAFKLHKNYLMGNGEVGNGEVGYGEMGNGEVACHPAESWTIFRQRLKIHLFSKSVPGYFLDINFPGLT